MRTTIVIGAITAAAWICHAEPTNGPATASDATTNVAIATATNAPAATDSSTNAAPAAGTSTNAAGKPLVDVDIVETGTREFKAPTIEEIAAAIKGLQSGLDKEVYAQFAEFMKLDLTATRDVDDLFKRCRDYDDAVAKRSDSVSYKRMGEYFKAVPFSKKTSAHFVLIHPKTVTVMRQGKPQALDAESVFNIDGILSGAESAYEKATETLFMKPFMNWGGKGCGKIFLIPDPAQWLLVRKGGAEPKPVQIVQTEDESREFYLFATPACRDYLDQAAGYGIAELVAKEYSTIMAKQTVMNSRFPLFFRCGFATEMAGLKSVLTEDGPRQLKLYKNAEIKTKEVLDLAKAAREGKFRSEQLPLMESRLRAFDRLVALTTYPRDHEDVYYCVRQSQALVKYLQENGQLPFVVFAKELGMGRQPDKAFDSFYAKLREAIVGKPEPGTKKERTKDTSKESPRDRQRKQLETKYTVDEVLRGYKELMTRAKDSIFLPLTESIETEPSSTEPKGGTTPSRPGTLPPSSGLVRPPKP